MKLLLDTHIFLLGAWGVTTKVAPEIHPEPYYVATNGAYGNLALDKGIPPIGDGNDLTLRFANAPPLRNKALSTYPIGRYMVSVPDTEHTVPGTYEISNGLKSRGDIIWVVP